MIFCMMIVDILTIILYNYSMGIIVGLCAFLQPDIFLQVNKVIKENVLCQR